MKGCLTCCSRVALILLLSASAALAQGTAQLSGTVRDDSGAVLPGVTVTATQTDTGLVRTVVSDGAGNYLLTNLPTGPYRLEASLSGFRTYVQSGIVLTVNATPAVNVVLALGELSEQITVIANAAMVETRSTGVGQLIENQRVLELPLSLQNNCPSQVQNELESDDTIAEEINIL